MSITITQTRPVIGIDRTPSRLELQKQDAKLELHQKQAKVDITTERPTVEIDQHDAFASAGLKNDLELAEEAAQRGYQQALDFIGKNAADGDRLAAIENGGNPIAEISKRDAYPEHEFGLTFLPKVGPKITVKGSIQFDPEPNSEGVDSGVEGTYIPGDVSADYTPTQINVSLKQYGSIDISYQGNNVDTYA